MADKKAATKTAAPAKAETTVAKSIINPKYRDAYKGKEKDWLAKLIDTHAGGTKTVTKKVPDGDGTKNVTSTVPDGVDVDKLHKLAEDNGLDIATLKGQSDTHGYPGRARMTIRNMLQTVAKQRHGLHAGGKFVAADPDFLTAKNAPETPSHKPNGDKIVAAKPAAEKAPAPAPAKEK